jgi:hypothetical protein
MPPTHQRLAFLDFFFFAFFFLAFLLAFEGAGAALSAGATAGAACAAGAACVAGATFCAWPSVGNAKAATDNKERSSLFMRLLKIENSELSHFVCGYCEQHGAFYEPSPQDKSATSAFEFTPQTHPPSSWHVAAPLPAPIETTHPLC